MSIKEYLRRLKVWRQQLCMDRLTILALVLINGVLVATCLSRKPAIELSLPFMDAQVGIQTGEAAQVYYEWWGLSLAEMLGNLNSHNLSFVESRLQSLFSPNLYQQVQDTLQQQFRQLRDDQISMSFEPVSLEFDEALQTIKVTGNSAMSSGQQRLKGQKTFTFQFNLIHYRPVLAAIEIESDLK